MNIQSDLRGLEPNVPVSPYNGAPLDEAWPLSRATRSDDLHAIEMLILACTKKKAPVSGVDNNASLEVNEVKCLLTTPKRGTLVLMFFEFEQLSRSK